MITARRIRRWGATSWAMLGVALVAVVAIVLVWELRVIVLPLFVAAIVAVALAPLAARLTRAGLPRGGASILTLLIALGAAIGLGALVAPSIVDQFAGIGDAADEAVDRLQRWVDRERPFGFTGGDVAELRERVSGVQLGEAAEAAGVSPLSGLRLVGTAVAAALLALVSTFFLLRDGPAIRSALVARAIAGGRADRMAAMCDGAVGGLRAFLAGAAVLGVVEGIAVGVALWATGSDLALVMAVLALVGAFVPFVGAIITGLLAVAVALVTGGPVAAVIVAIVVLVVQQLDNDLLAPLIYGRLLRLHPLVVILATAAGIEAAGVIGAFVTVPLVAAGTGAYRGWNGAGRDGAHPDLDPGGPRTAVGGDQAPG